MTINKEVFHSAVRIIGDKDGDRAPIGTGFFVDIPREGIDNQRPSAAPGPLREPATCRYLITTRHVLNGQTNVEVVGWSRAGGHLGPFPVPDWRVPDESLDLAIAPFRVAPTYSSGLSLSPSGIQLNVIPNTFFATHPRYFFPTVDVTQLHLGGTIFYVGLLAPPYDRLMVRSGTLGAIDERDFPHAIGTYTCHLVDCRSYAGFSGSPCFYVVPFTRLTPMATPSPGLATAGPVGSPVNRPVLVGIFTQHLNDSSPSVEAVSRYGIGVMLRVEDIQAVLMSPAFIRDRLEWDTAS